MGSLRILRAVRRADGSYRIAVDPPVAGLDTSRAYTATEVQRLASDLGAELRWVTAPEQTRGADIWGGTQPTGDQESADTWGGAQPTGDQESADRWGGTLAAGDED